MWRRNGAIRRKRAFPAGVARGQREFHRGSGQSKKPANAAFIVVKLKRLN
jgi:hypothetical protein